MKKYILTMAILALVCGTASAQGLLGRLGERAKQAVENNIGNKIEQGINNAIDGKKKNKNVSGNQETEEAEAPAEKVDFAAVNRTLSEIQKKIEQSLAEWETAAEELEAVRLENERIHQES